MSEIAIKLITEYIENWGQPDSSRIKALQNALDAAGINVVAYVDEGGYHCFRGEESEKRRAFHFTISFGPTFARTFEKTEQNVDELIDRFKAGDET